MLEVREFRVRSLDLQSALVSWELAPTPEEALDFRFQILRSEAEGGPWQEMTDPFVDRYLFIDNRPEPFSQNRILFYLLRVTSKTGESKDWGPVSQGDEPDLVAMDVRAHWDVRLREFVGRRCWLFPVRTFGTICRNCYDPITQRVVQSSCEQCYGTGFARGFHHPIETWLQILPEPRSEKIGGAIVRQDGATIAYASAFPSIKGRDLVVAANHERWRVAGVKTTRRLGTILHQEATLADCAPGDVEFLVPVRVDDLPGLALAAERNYRYRTTV